MGHIYRRVSRFLKPHRSFVCVCNNCWLCSWIHWSSVFSVCVKAETKGLWLKAAQVVVLPRGHGFYLDVHFLDLACLPWVGIMIAVCLSSKLKAGGGMCFGGVTQFSSAFSSVILLWLSIMVWAVGVCVCVCVTCFFKLCPDAFIFLFSHLKSAAFWMWQRSLNMARKYGE